MDFDKEKVTVPLRAVLNFIQWVLYSCGIGLLVGGAAVAFHYGVDWATAFRGEHPQMIWTLPLGGMAIIFLYRVCGMEKDRGTNLVILAAREAEPMRFRTAPLIFVSTILTHLVGGSAGREGAALQLGGSMAAWVGRKIRLTAKDHRVMVMCGMAAAFSALFGTPLTAAIFAMEVVSVGVMQYSALVPCLVSSLVGFQLSLACGLHEHGGYLITEIPGLTVTTAVQAVVLGALCAVLSILFCTIMHNSHKLYGLLISDPVLRAAVGGGLVLTMTLLVGSQDYNGAGDPVIRRMLAGEIIPAAFLLKMVFTGLTLGAGFRGGEIVPALFVGCAFGTWAGPMLGLSSSFAGSLGMAAVFCGATNCPLSSMLIAFELFGGQSLPLYALCCAVSYRLSGYYGLYSAQKILYSKLSLERVDKSIH